MRTSKNEILVCDVCGITSKEKAVHYRRKYDRVLCDKHSSQLKVKGMITDPSPRGCFDPNEYEIKDNVVYMKLYNRQQEVIGITMFDVIYLDYIKQFVWRPVCKSYNKYYAATIGRPESGLSHEYMHRMIMELAGIDMGDYEVDHINSNSLDNRLENLRLLSTQEQKWNMKPQHQGKIPVRGVSFSTRDNDYHLDFRMGNVRFYTKHWETAEEAAYARYIFERELSGQLSLNQSMQYLQPYIERLDESKKLEIEKYVLQKIDEKEKINAEVSELRRNFSRSA